MYTAFSADGLVWEQASPWGFPNLLGAYGEPGPVPFSNQSAGTRRVGDTWAVPLSESDAMNAMWDPKSKQYRVYSKTWIDGIDGNMFWKRAVAMHASTDLVDFPSNTGHLCLYPDEHDGVDTAYLPGSGNVGVELHAGQCAFLRRIPSEYAPCHVYGTKLTIYRSNPPVFAVIETNCVVFAFILTKQWSPLTFTGPVAYLASADIYVMFLQHLNWYAASPLNPFAFRLNPFAFRLSPFAFRLLLPHVLFCVVVSLPR